MASDSGYTPTDGRVEPSQPPRGDERCREHAKGPLHEALHTLGPRIPGLDVGDCHCNLLAEVALDALGPTFAEVEREVRAKIAAEIRAKAADVVRRAEHLAGTQAGEADGHPFTLGCEWAARIAEEGTTPPEESRMTPTAQREQDKQS